MFFNKKPEWNIHLEKSEFLVPTYYKPIMKYCRLPSGLYYLSIVKPGRQVPLETALTNEDFVSYIYLFFILQRFFQNYYCHIKFERILLLIFIIVYWSYFWNYENNGEILIYVKYIFQLF